jgi:hypothetical protein
VMTAYLNTSGYIDGGEFIHKMCQYQLAKKDFVPHYLYCSNDITAVISGPLSPRDGASSGCGWRNGLKYGG